MKKLLVAIAIIIVIVITLLGKFGFGFGIGSGSGESGEGTTRGHLVENIDDSPVLEVEDTEDTNESTIIQVQVSVAKSEYFYENKSIKLEDLVNIIKSIEGEFVIEISDDNAALKAYNRLLDELDKLDIHYVEEIVE